MNLLKRDPNSPKFWEGNLPVSSRYTFGLSGERFFRGIQAGKIFGTRCPNCERVYVPAAIFCERCLAELDEWIDVGTTGKLHTFTLLYKNYDGSQRETPVITALVEFGDGGLIHYLEEVDLQGISIGMEVEAVFKPESEREGSILDIAYFRPI
jgi:uncharacterized OB-fold protein